MIIAGCIICTLLVGVLAFLPVEACCYRPARDTGHVWEWHHGFLVVFVGVPITWVQVLALVIGCEDLLQHLMQKFGPDPKWQGPIHRFAAVTWYKWFP